MTTVSTSFVKLQTEVTDKSDVVEKRPKVTTEEQREMEFLAKCLPELNDVYQLHKKIGKGTFSNVYLATLRWNSSSEKFAVKHLTQFREKSRIKIELECLEVIGGKDNVVQATRCLTNGNDCLAFIMPYLPHLRFADYVVDMDAEETRCYMKNLFIALKRVHSFNIIHRDVKPDNFLYNRETKQFLLVDFGLAQYVRTSNRDINKTKPSVDENLPINCVKKRKRNSSEDDEKTLNKTNKRIALKSKDNNIKLFTPSKSIQETKTEAVTREKEELKSPVKQWTEKPDVDKTPMKSRTFTPTNVAATSRRKLLDCSEINSLKPNLANEVRTPVENNTRLLKDVSFTPLVPSKTNTTNFVQVKNSRVIRQQPVTSTSKDDTQKQTPSTSFTQTCPCNGIGAVCSICKCREPMFAPRAGTSGFRPPEVLFRYLYQTTAVDIWASGVIMLCILSGCYPFFNSSTDLVSLAEIMTIFGTERTMKVAAKFGRRIVCSEHSKGVDLKKLCSRLRARAAKRQKGIKSSSNEPRCRDCNQTIKEDGCICPSDDPSEESTSDKSNPSRFPDSAFDLLYRLLDLDPTTRITAAEALEHPFITGAA